MTKAASQYTDQKQALHPAIFRNLPWLLIGFLCFLLVGRLAWIEPRLSGLMLNSVFLMLGTALIALPVGGFLGFAIFRTNMRGRGLMLALIICGLFMPLYVYAAAWAAGFGQLGWFPLLGENATPLLSGWRGAIWVHAMAAIPWVSLIIGSAATKVNATREEAALLDVAPAKVFLQVTLRTISPACGAAVLWISLMTAGEMTITDIFRIRTYVEEVYLNSQLDQFSSTPPISQWAVGVETFSIALREQLLVVGVLVLIAISFVMLLKPASHTDGQPMQFLLGRWKLLTTAISILIMMLLFGIPIGNLVYKSGAENIPHDGWHETTWSLRVLLTNLSAVPSRYGVHFQWSAAITILSAMLALTISLPLAWLARKANIVKSLPALIVIAIGIAIPGPTIAMLLIALFDQPNSSVAIFLYDHTLLAPVIAIVIRVLPLTLLFCWNSMRTVNDLAIDDAKLVGVSPLGRFWMFAIVQQKTTIAAAFLISAVFAAGDLTASNLVMPPGVDPLPRRVFGLIHAGVDDQVAVLSLSSVLLITPLAGILLLIVRQR